MSRLLRALGYGAAAALLMRWLQPGSITIGPWLPGVAIAITSVAFGLERLKASEGPARRAPVGLAFGVGSAALVVALYGLSLNSLGSAAVACLAAAVAVPMVGVAFEAFPGKDRKAHGLSGLVGLCALLPLGVYFLPWWLHPVTHWNPLFWVHHTFLRLHLSAEQLEASGIRFPATFEWEYAFVPIVEAALYTWLAKRRIRRMEALGAA